MTLNLSTRPAPRNPDRDQESDSGRSIVRNAGNSTSPGNGGSQAKISSSEDLLSGDPSREFILICGKDGVGKSCSIVSLAWYIQLLLNPEATFYVIDTENKFRTALRGFGEDAPTNIVCYKTDDMNQVTWALNDIMSKHKPGDWVAVESMSRVWERAQDLGYMAVSGYSKVEYMERRAEMEGKKAPVTPSPDQLWNVTKGAHDGAFLDKLAQSETLNVILSTTLSKPPKEGSFIKENADRRAMRAEVGIDSGIEGAPRLPYYVETLCMLEMKNGGVKCRVLRDNVSPNDETRLEFEVEGKKTWATNFWTSCRR